MLDDDDMSKIKNNTIIGDSYPDTSEEMLKKMLKNSLINLPGATPMNT